MVAIIITGILGNITAEITCRIFKITHPGVTFETVPSLACHYLLSI